MIVVNLLVSPTVDVISFMFNSTTHVRIMHTLDVACFIFDAPVNTYGWVPNVRLDMGLYDDML